MRVDHEQRSASYQRAELRSDDFFKCKVWYTQDLLPSYDKGSYYSFDFNYPCWAWHYGTSNGVHLVELVQAANEDILQTTRPFPSAQPILRGISWLIFGEDVTTTTTTISTSSSSSSVSSSTTLTTTTSSTSLIVPDPTWIPMTMTFTGHKDTAWPQATIWDNRDLIWVLPEAMYLSFFAEAGFMELARQMASKIIEGEYTVEYKERKL